MRRDIKKQGLSTWTHIWNIINTHDIKNIFFYKRYTCSRVFLNSSLVLCNQNKFLKMHFNVLHSWTGCVFVWQICLKCSNCIIAVHSLCKEYILLQQMWVCLLNWSLFLVNLTLKSHSFIPQRHFSHYFITVRIAYG